MSEARRRVGLAVDRVERMEEPKEHVHLDRVVRQGAVQVGMVENCDDGGSLCSSSLLLSSLELSDTQVYEP